MYNSYIFLPNSSRVQSLPGTLWVARFDTIVPETYTESFSYRPSLATRSKAGDAATTALRRLINRFSWNICTWKITNQHFYISLCVQTKQTPCELVSFKGVARCIFELWREPVVLDTKRTAKWWKSAWFPPKEVLQIYNSIVLIPPLLLREDSNYSHDHKRSLIRKTSSLYLAFEQTASAVVFF